MYEINKVIVFSIQHLPRKCQDFLIYENNRMVPRQNKAGLIIKSTPESWQILADNSHLAGDQFTKIPAKLLELQEIATDNGCKWLVIDCDGPEYAHLEVFDWE